MLKKAESIIFKDGVRINMSSPNDQWFDDDILREEMKYLAKISEGISTGSMVNDHEYIEFKDKIVAGFIDDRIKVVKKRLGEKIKEKERLYSHADDARERAIKNMNDNARKIADARHKIKTDSAIEIDLDKNSPCDGEVRMWKELKNYWEEEDAKKEIRKSNLGRIILDEEDENIIKEIENRRKLLKKPAEKTKKKVAKKTTSKKEAKKTKKTINKKKDNK